jgi:hypothetical protein
MSPEELDCWKCGGNLKAVPLPYGRRAECPACHAELHVCRMCRHFAPGKAKQCMETMAEEVKDKTRANFCDWLQPGPNKGATATPEPGRSTLASLFGEAPVDPAGTGDDARKALDDLFGR